jgi:RNA polymerase sigma-70 factor (ECF subfamily)
MGENEEIVTRYYETHRQELVEKATTLLRGDSTTAEDMVQSIFLKLLTVGHPICELSLPAITYTSLRHLLGDYWRRKQRRDDFERHVKMNGSDTHDEMFSVCSAAQITQLLEQQVAAMSPNTATIISMSLWEEKSVADISRELGINYKTTENNLLRARKQLRSYLDRILA